MAKLKSNDFTNIEKLTEIITEIIKPYSFEDMANAVFCINSYAGNRSLIEVSLALNNAIIEYNDFGEKRINSYTDFSNLCRKLGDAIGKQSFVDYIDPDMGEVKISAFDNVYSVILGTGYNNCFSKIHSLPTLAELLECEEHVKYIFEYSSAMIDSLRHINSQLDDEEYSELNVPPEDFYNVATKSFGICQSKWNLEQIDRFIKQDFIERTHFVRRKERYFPLYNTSILMDVYDQLCTLLSDEQESRLIDNVINKLLWDIYKYDVGIKSKMLSPCMLVDSNDPIAGEKGLVFTMAGKNGIIIGLNATVYDDAELDGVCNKIQKAHHNKTLSSIELMHRCSETAYLKASLSSDKVFVVLINSVLTHEHEEVQNKYYSFVSECSLSDMIYYLCFSDDADELINYLQFKHNHSNMKILGFGGDSSLFLTWKLQNERIEGGAVSFTMLTLDPSIDSSYVINYYNEMFSKYPWYRDPLMDPVYSWKHKVITDGVLESVSKSGNFGGRLFLFAEANFKLFNCTNTEFFLEEKEVEEISKFQDIDEITFTIIESLRSSFNHCKELDSLTIELLQMPSGYFRKNVGSNESLNGRYVNSDSKFVENTVIIRYSINYDCLISELSKSRDRSVEVEYIKELFMELNKYYPSTYLNLSNELENIKQNKRLVGLYEASIEYKYNGYTRSLNIGDKYYIDARKLIAHVCLENEIEPGIYKGDDANRLVRTIQRELINRFEKEVCKFNSESLHVLCLEHYAQAVHEFVWEKTKYYKLEDIDESEKKIIQEKIIEYRKELQHRMNDLLYLIETNLSINRNEDKDVSDEEFNFLYALSHWLVLLSETADICHYISDWIYLSINSEYNIDTEIYEIDGAANYNKRTYESQDYEISNDENDKVHLDRVLAGFESDTGCTFRTVLDVLTFLEMSGTEIAKVKGDNVYCVNLYEVVNAIQEELSYAVPYEELYRAIDFLCVIPDKLKECKGKTDYYIPIGKRKERDNRFEIRPLLVDGNSIIFSPPHLDYVKNRWRNGILGFYPPFEYGLDKMCDAIALWKKDYEEKIVDEVAGYFKTSEFDFVKKDVYLHKLDKTGNHPKDLGDYDVLAINTSTKEIWMIECKVIKKVGSFYEMYQQQHHFFDVDKYDVKFNKRIKYMEANYPRLLSSLGIAVDEYKVVPMMCINKVFTSRFKDVGFEIVSLDELRQIICSDK